MRRDLAGLVDYGRSLRPDVALWDHASDLAVLAARDLRRKLEYAELQHTEKAQSDTLDTVRNLLDGENTEKMSTTDVTTVQHYQNSNLDSYDFEPRLEKAQSGNGEDESNTGVCIEPDQSTEGLDPLADHRVKFTGQTSMVPSPNKLGNRRSR